MLQKQLFKKKKKKTTKIKIFIIQNICSLMISLINCYKNKIYVRNIQEKKHVKTHVHVRKTSEPPNSTAHLRKYN